MTMAWQPEQYFYFCIVLGAEGAQGDDAGASNQGPGKSGQPKQKGKKRHGYVISG